MEHKKPRLELLSESDYETDSETGSETSSSNVSSSASSLVRSSSLPSLTSSTSNVPSKTSSLVIPNVLPSKTSVLYRFKSAHVQPLATPKTYSAVASKILRPASNANTNVSYTKPTVPSSSISNLSSAGTSSMPTPSTSKIPSSETSIIPPDSSGAAHNEDQIRASFKSACEEVNHELDIIMQPLKKQQTLNTIEDYLVSLSKQAKQSFVIDLIDDSHSTKVSLKVDKNKVTIFSQNTPNQQGEDGQQSEGAASNAPGPSRVVQNSGGACWMPPVNPFTSSVTLRQHLEAASNNVRPRRMRPPPGFHPTPQYNVSNLGSSTSVVEGQNSSTGVVRPPPGFHGIAGHGSAVSPGPPNVAAVSGSGSGSGSGPGSGPGPSTSSVHDYYGLLDTQAIIADLYRQSLSVVRQNAELATSQSTSTANANNIYVSTNPEQLLYSMVPRQRHQGAEFQGSTSTVQYGYGQSQGSMSMQNTSVVQGNELWRHFTNAAAEAAASGSYIGTSGTGYWDDFLQREVYDNITTDQNSDLWKQFEEYQRIQYAPGSLRTGSTIFTSENTGASKHGPVGHCRPSSLPHVRSRRLENISIQRNFEQLPIPLPQRPRYPPNLGCRQMFGQDVVTLSDRFKNAAISIPLNIRPTGNELIPNRNASLGALLHNRLKERAASIFTGNTNTTMNFPASALTTLTSSSSSSRNANTNIGISSGGATGPSEHNNAASLTADQLPCSYCMQNNKSAGSPTHVLRDMQGRTVCPVLRNKPCPICNQAGDNAHTVHDCPIRKQWDMEMNNDKVAKKST